MHWALKLRKWYLDGVSPAGDVCIGYQADLQLGPLATGYRGLLLRRADGRAQDRSGWGRGTAPHLQVASGWQWSEWMQGHWVPQGPGMSALLWDEAGVRIHWRCLAPRCLTRVKAVCAGEPVDWHLDGYLECLDLSLSRLALPLRCLRWGRAIAGPHSVVWIEWDDGKTLSRVWLDGAAVAARLEGEGPERIAGEGWQLDLQRQAVLRDRAMDRFLPDSLLPHVGALAQLHEEKWLGQARFVDAQAGESSGWAIHERVEWQ